MVFCTEFLDGWWSWEPMRRSFVRCGKCRAAPSAPYKRSTQWLSRPPTIQKLGAENHTLQLNIQCSWWWAYVPETCRAKNTLIKLPYCIKLAFQVIPLFLYTHLTENIFRNRTTLYCRLQTRLRHKHAFYESKCYCSVHQFLPISHLCVKAEHVLQVWHSNEP